jgi:hypothetical protein
MSDQHLFGQFERCDSLLAAHTGKMIEEHRKGLASFKIIQQRFHRHTRTNKDWGTPQDVRITMDNRWLPWHMSTPFRVTLHRTMMVNKGRTPGLSRAGYRVGSRPWLDRVMHTDFRRSADHPSWSRRPFRSVQQRGLSGVHPQPDRPG